MARPEWHRLLLALLALLAPLLPAQQLADPAAAQAGSEQNAELSPEQQLLLQLRNLVTSWASAWQSQLDEIYLLHYHPDFVAEDFASREDWEASRRARLVEPGAISIGLRDFELVQSDRSSAVVRFRLDYSRPGYADQTWKELQLARNGELWQILRERNLAVQRMPVP